MMTIDISRAFVPLVGFRYYTHSEYVASIYGDRGKFQIYAYSFLITIDMPWRHVTKTSTDAAAYFSPWRKKFTFRRWGSDQ
jgi:hypothetical protein